MRILHVITGLWKNTGGPAEVIPAICTAMVDAGMGVTLATLAGDSAQSVEDAAAHGVRVLRFSPTVRHTIWYSSELHRRIQDLASEHDIVHIHGIWQFPDWVAAAAARRAGIPYVISPHGLLQPARLKKSSLKKRVAAILADRAMLNQASCLHATAHDEADAFRLFGYRGARGGLAPRLSRDAGPAVAVVPVPHRADQGRDDTRAGLGRVCPTVSRLASRGCRA
jgi:glycosyltransferase involved in cell wall biosynthesis